MEERTEREMERDARAMTTVAVSNEAAAVCLSNPAWFKVLKAELQRRRRNARARARHAAYTDLGMVRVRGAQGGVYYE